MKRYAVLGGCGFLGKTLVAEIERRGDVALTFDIAPEANVRVSVLELKAKHLHGCDEVLDLAGGLGTAETFNHVQTAVLVNVMGALNVLNVVKELRVPMRYVGLDNGWLNPYTITKNAARDFCLMYAEEYGIEVLVALTYNLFGPHQKRRPVRKIVPTFMCDLLERKVVEVWGDGEQVVDLIYAPDFARALLDCEQLSGLARIGTAAPTTVNEAARMCAEALGLRWIDYAVLHLPRRMGEPERSSTLAPVDNMPGRTPLNKALRETAAWYREHLSSL